MASEAIVLAGGLGTRLSSIVQDVPKPMAEVSGRPFLDFILYVLKKNNVNRVIFAVGHKYEIIQSYYLQQENNFGIEIEYSVETELLGTGGAIFQAVKSIQNDSFYVLNGDTFFGIDLIDFQDFAQTKQADLAIALKKMPHSERYGSVICSSNDEVISFKEKQLEKNDILINGGIYYMRKNVLLESMPNKFSFETDLLQKKLHQLNVYGKPYDATFIDIGVPEDYYKAQLLLKDVIK